MQRHVRGALLCALVPVSATVLGPALGCAVDDRGAIDDTASGVQADAAPWVGDAAAGRAARYRAFADRIAGELDAAGVPGGALGIVENGRLVFATGLGVKAAGSDQLVGVHTAFRVASVTKPFTAAAALSLVEDGRIELDAPITRQIPELALHAPADPRRITLRQLLAHTAGVPDYLELECDESAGAIGRWFAAHPNLVLWTPPGRLWSYSNLGYSLAGLALERAAGRSFPAVIEERILQPLHMDTATFDVDEVIARGDYATATPTEPVDPTLLRCALAQPPGYLYASVMDLGRFAEAMLSWGGAILRPSSVVQMAWPQSSTQAPPDTAYALGLIEQPYRGTVVIGHGGDLPGLHSAWIAVPEHRFAVVMLVNGDGYPPARAAAEAFDTFLPLADVPPRDWSTPPSDWRRYVGTYDDGVPADGFPQQALGRITVALEGEHLMLTTLADGERYELIQAARDTFVVDAGDASIAVTFWRDLTGRAAYLASRLGAAHRVAATASAADAVAARAAIADHPFARALREHRTDLGLPLPPLAGP